MTVAYHPSAPERIDREAIFLAQTLAEVNQSTPEQLAVMAQNSANDAEQYAQAAQEVDGRSRLALLWLSGRSSLRALVYRAGADQ